jgi:hypothetical protein
MDIEILYNGTESLRVILRDGRAIDLSMDQPQRMVPSADALDLLSPAVGGRRFVCFTIEVE